MKTNFEAKGIIRNSSNVLNCMFLRWSAGTENAFLNYAKCLTESGFKVINLVHPRSEIIPILEKNNLPYIKSLFLGKFGKYDPFTLIYFIYLIKKYKINLIFAHQGKLIALFKKIRNQNRLFKNVRLIGVNHGHNPKHNVGTDFAITVNNYSKIETIKLGQKEHKISTLPHSIELNNKEIIKSNNINNKTFRVGSYGRLSHEKGYDILLESLKILNQNNLDFVCNIGGTGIEEENLKKFTKNNNLENKVNFIGWIKSEKDKEKFFNNIDLFIVPSRKEEFGLVILEAQKYKTPVLSTKCGGPKDIIKDKISGFLIEKENPKEMAEKIVYIVKNKEKLEEIINNAYEILQKDYSYESFKNNLNQIIKKVIA